MWCWRKPVRYGASLARLVISVNISAVEFNTRGTAKRVKSCAAKSGLEPSRLELEITENVTISNPDITLETMEVAEGYRHYAF